VSVKLAPVIRNVFCKIYEQVTTDASKHQPQNESMMLQIFSDALQTMQTSSDETIYEYVGMIKNQIPKFDMILANLYSESHFFFQEEMDVAFTDKIKMQFLKELFAMIACAIARNLPLLRRKNVLEFQKVLQKSLRSVCAAFVDIDSPISSRSSRHSVATSTFGAKRYRNDERMNESNSGLHEDFKKQINIPTDDDRHDRHNRKQSSNSHRSSTTSSDVGNVNDLADFENHNNHHKARSVARSVSRASSSITAASTSSALSKSSLARQHLAGEKRKQAESLKKQADALLSSAEQLEETQTEVGEDEKDE
jgi:hypothetical protein